MTLEHGPSDATPSHGLAQMDAAGLRFVFKLGDDLSLGSKEICALLGGISADEYAQWRARPDKAVIAANTRERLSYLAGIWADLFSLFGGNSDRALAWFKAPNSGAPFDGGTALEHLLRTGMRDLMEVRSYLRAARYG